MTNNINDIDVSECSYFIDHTPPKGQGDWCGAIHKGACKVYSEDCEYNKDCYFKQLKQLEQREKALNEIADDLQKRNHDLTLTNEQLEQENEELKKRQISKIGFICDCEQNAKYRQALEEIRSYCDEQNLKADYTACYITNMIDEVLNDRD